MARSTILARERLALPSASADEPDLQHDRPCWRLFFGSPPANSRGLHEETSRLSILRGRRACEISPSLFSPYRTERSSECVAGAGRRNVHVRPARSCAFHRWRFPKAGGVRPSRPVHGRSPSVHVREIAPGPAVPACRARRALRGGGEPVPASPRS